MLLSASVNSISSMPSPVYQCKKALERVHHQQTRLGNNPTLRLNIAVNCSEILLKSSWMAVELPMKVADILRPLGGMSHTAVLMLFGILENSARLGIAITFPKCFPMSNKNIAIAKVSLSHYPKTGLTTQRSRSCFCSGYPASARQPPSRWNLKIWRNKCSTTWQKEWKVWKGNLHRHPSSEDSRHSQITSMPRYQHSFQCRLQTF